MSKPKLYLKLYLRDTETVNHKSYSVSWCLVHCWLIHKYLIQLAGWLIWKLTERLLIWLWHQNQNSHPLADWLNGRPPLLLYELEFIRIKSSLHFCYQSLLFDIYWLWMDDQIPVQGLVSDENDPDLDSMAPIVFIFIRLASLSAYKAQTLNFRANLHRWKKNNRHPLDWFNVFC